MRPLSSAIKRVSMVAAGATITVMVLGKVASAASLTGSYFKLPQSNPDVNRGIDGVVTGLVATTLGPNGLPVATTFARTRTSGSGPVKDFNPVTNEILWWTDNGRPNGAISEKTQIDNLPYSFPNFYPDGQSGDNPFFRAVHWQGNFTLATSGTVTFNSGSDDDAWIFVDSGLQVDNGGVHGNSVAPTQTTTLSAGSHTVDLFFADRYPTNSSLTFSANVALNPNPTTNPNSTSVPEPSDVLGTLAFGTIGAGYLLKRQLKKAAI